MPLTFTTFNALAVATEVSTSSATAFKIYFHKYSGFSPCHQATDFAWFNHSLLSRRTVSDIIY